MPNKYSHNTERWLRNQAKIYTRRGNTGMACVFERCADDYAASEARYSELRAAARVVLATEDNLELCGVKPAVEVHLAARDRLAALVLEVFGK